MNESAVVISSSNGVGIVVKKNNQKESLTPFSYSGDDALVTKVINSKFSIPSNMKKCEVKSLGSSSAIVVFGTADDRKKVLKIISDGIKDHVHHFNQQIPLKELSNYVGNEINKLSHTSATMACCVEIILTSWNIQNGSEVYGIDSSGDGYSFQACAIGDDKNRLRFKLSQLNLQNLTTNQSLVEGLKIFMDESEGNFDFEVTRISSDTHGIYEAGSDEFCKQILQETIRSY